MLSNLELRHSLFATFVNFLANLVNERAIESLICYVEEAMLLLLCCFVFKVPQLENIDCWIDELDDKERSLNFFALALHHVLLLRGVRVHFSIWALWIVLKNVGTRFDDTRERLLFNVQMFSDLVSPSNVVRFSLEVVEQLLNNEQVRCPDENLKALQMKKLTGDLLASRSCLDLLTNDQLVVEQTVSEIMQQLAVFDEFIE